MMKSFFHSLKNHEQGNLEFPQSANLSQSLIKWINVHQLQELSLYVFDHDSIHEEVRRGWEKFKRNTLLKNMTFINAGETFCRLADKVGVKCTAMRGLNLILSVYPKIWIRKMGDIDILIDPADKLNLYNGFADHNILPYKELRSQYIYKFQKARIELHWMYLTSKRFNYRMDTSDFLAKRQKIVTQSGYIYHLQAEQEFIGLVCHAIIHHSLSIFKQILDIALYIENPEMDWNYIVGWCKRYRMIRMFRFTIRLASIIFGLDISHLIKKFEIDTTQRTMYLENHINLFFCRKKGDYFINKLNMIYLSETARSMMGTFFRIFSLEEFEYLKMRNTHKQGE
ncbi:MAG: nucleotidyltransferase family protein [Candidatus Stygibacter australis]|nr:nucleotidyltransferase family protein [Candidatus Stygibacter australis]